jgi:hypothetical protein
MIAFSIVELYKTGIKEFVNKLIQQKPTVKVVGEEEAVAIEHWCSL